MRHCLSGNSRSKLKNRGSEKKEQPHPFNPERPHPRRGGVHCKLTGNRAEIGRMLRRLAAQVKVKLRIARIGKFNEPAVKGITRCGKAVSASFENAIVTTAPRN